MKQNGLVKYEAFEAISPSAAMDVSGGRCMNVASIATITKTIQDFFGRLGDFIGGFFNGFIRGYEVWS